MTKHRYYKGITITIHECTEHEYLFCKISEYTAVVETAYVYDNPPLVPQCSNTYSSLYKLDIGTNQQHNTHIVIIV